MDRQQEWMIQQNLAGYVGQRYTLVHLKSTQYNGLPCKVTGYNDRKRLDVQLDDGRGISVKCSNLLPINIPYNYTPDHGPALSQEQLLPHLREALRFAEADHVCSERPDCVARIAYVRPHIQQGRVPPPSTCMDMFMSEDAINKHGHLSVMSALKPCCVGDALVDFTRFAAGLVGNGGQCAVCLDTVKRGQQALGFPCGHLFHKECASQWLRQQNTCPQCRFQLHQPGVENAYLFDFEERLRIRVREWFISGMCERCQSLYQESSPLCVVKGPDGVSHLVPRSELP